MSVFWGSRAHIPAKNLCEIAPCDYLSVGSWFYDGRSWRRMAAGTGQAEGNAWGFFLGVGEAFPPW